MWSAFYDKLVKFLCQLLLLTLFVYSTEWGRRSSRRVSWRSITLTCTIVPFMTPSGRPSVLLCCLSPSTVRWLTILPPIVNRSTFRWRNSALTIFSGKHVKNLYANSRRTSTATHTGRAQTKSVHCCFATFCLFFLSRNFSRLSFLWIVQNNLQFYRDNLL